jgi:hypothetical protein
VVGFFELRDSTEFDASSASGFFRRHASANIFLGEHIEMGIELVGKILIDSTRREPRASARGERRYPGKH